MPDGAYSNQIEIEKNAIAESKLQDSLPLLAIKCAEGIFLATPNASCSLKKIREVYPGIVFGAIGEIPALEKCYEYLVNISHLQELRLSPNDVSVWKLSRMIADQLWQAMNDSRTRPTIIKFVLAAVKPEPLILTVSYDGSVKEDKDFSAVSSKAQEEEMENSAGKYFKADLSSEEAHVICKRMFASELAKKNRSLEAALLKNNGELAKL